MQYVSHRNFSHFKRVNIQIIFRNRYVFFFFFFLQYHYLLYIFIMYYLLRQTLNVAAIHFIKIVYWYRYTPEQGCFTFTDETSRMLTRYIVSDRNSGLSIKRVFAMASDHRCTREKNDRKKKK